MKSGLPWISMIFVDIRRWQRWVLAYVMVVAFTISSENNPKKPENRLGYALQLLN